MNLAELPVILAVGFGSAIVGTVAGAGGSTVLLPVLVLYYGVQDAVAIMTIANLSANASRVWVTRRDVRWAVAGWFCLTSVPLTLAGAVLFTVTDPGLITRLLGGFMILVLVWRRAPLRPPRIPSPRWFAPLGIVLGFIGGLMPGTGVLMAPFFLAFGLVKSSYIGTDSLITVLSQVTKLTVFSQAALLNDRVLLVGLSLIPLMVLGAAAGKRILDRVPERVFVIMIEGMLLLAGLNFLFRG